MQCESKKYQTLLALQHSSFVTKMSLLREKSACIFQAYVDLVLVTLIPGSGETLGGHSRAANLPSHMQASGSTSCIGSFLSHYTLTG